MGGILQQSSVFTVELTLSIALFMVRMLPSQFWAQKNMWTQETDPYYLEDKIPSICEMSRESTGKPKKIPLKLKEIILWQIKAEVSLHDIRNGELIA